MTSSFSFITHAGMTTKGKMAWILWWWVNCMRASKQQCERHINHRRKWVLGPYPQVLRVSDTHRMPSHMGILDLFDYLLSGGIGNMRCCEEKNKNKWVNGKIVIGGTSRKRNYCKWKGNSFKKMKVSSKQSYTYCCTRMKAGGGMAR